MPGNRIDCLFSRDPVDKCTMQCTSNAVPPCPPSFQDGHREDCVIDRRGEQAEAVHHSEAHDAHAWAPAGQCP